MATVRDFPGRCRARNDTGRFRTNAKKKDIASIANGTLAIYIATARAIKPMITSQNLTNVPVLTLSLTSRSVFIPIVYHI